MPQCVGRGIVAKGFGLRAGRRGSYAGVVVVAADLQIFRLMAMSTHFPQKPQ